MDLERIFSVASVIAAVGWLFLIVVPKRPLAASRRRRLLSARCWR